MPTLKQIPLASMFVLALLTTVAAQASTGSSIQRPSLTITAAAAGEHVRITAPSSIVQLRVEVYAHNGEKLFDQEIKGSNVFDWQLRDSQAKRLAPGAYVCVVTAKNTSGQLSQRIGAVRVAENSANVQTAGSLSAPLAQAIGPVEEDSAWTVATKDDPQTTTVIANDGTDGQMIRGRGALTFRIGNFFSGDDKEQMRLTEAGNLGLGTSDPKAKLDVAGTIRAERVLIARPNKTGSETLATDPQANEATDSVQTLTSGTGTTNLLPKWTDGANGVLGDSIITEFGGNIGIGQSAPTQPLMVSKAAGGVGASSAISFDITGAHAAVSTYAFQARSSKGVGQFGIDTFFDPAGVGFMSTTALGGFVFSANNNDQHLRILPTGNIGMGTSTPSSPGGFGRIFQIEGAFPGLVLNSTSGGGRKYTIGSNSTLGAGYLDFYDETAGVSRIAIAADGNVGIGTTAPDSALTVNGVINSATGGFKFPDGTVQTTAVPTSGIKQVLRGVISFSGDTFQASQTFATSANAVDLSKTVVMLGDAIRQPGNGNGPAEAQPVLLVSLTDRVITVALHVSSSTPGLSPHKVHYQIIEYK